MKEMMKRMKKEVRNFVQTKKEGFSSSLFFWNSYHKVLQFQVAYVVLTY